MERDCDGDGQGERPARTRRRGDYRSRPARGELRGCAGRGKNEGPWRRFTIRYAGERPAGKDLGERKCESAGVRKCESERQYEVRSTEYATHRRAAVQCSPLPLAGEGSGEGASRGLDSVADGSFVCYGAAARPRVSGGMPEPAVTPVVVRPRCAGSCRWPRCGARRCGRRPGRWGSRSRWPARTAGAGCRRSRRPSAWRARRSSRSARRTR